ncbi:hypothetical protein [Lutibacter citreus]|uniref:hypothetical protein n=1 Tax=Lutibacter citreus TaxID=2138210 RepID=UPI000DBE54F3|nr:hypothetical protein [Lutibacter citreus]
MEAKSESLVLTSEYFKLVLDKILDIFIHKHEITNIPRTFQLYGYGSFDESKPNLKNDFEEVGNEFINGKYLYDKTREFEKGKPLIKINKYYKSVILLYIGYDNFVDFINTRKSTDEDKERQLSLLTNHEDATYYYLNYYFDEDNNSIIKGKTIISNNWKKIQHIFFYPLEDGSFREIYTLGTVNRQEDTITIKTQTPSGKRFLEGASEIYYIGNKAPSNINYLVGTYCNFDIYNNTVAGRSILEKCDGKDDMEQKAKSPYIPPYIAMEIRNKRIVNNNNVPRHFLELSEKSPYASIYEKIPGAYEITFQLEDNIKEIINFQILPNSYKIITLTENVYIEKDRLELINKGSVINLRFTFTGIIALERVNFYLKTYYLKGEEYNQTGVFSGIDNENRLVNGTLTINFTPYS